MAYMDCGLSLEANIFSNIIKNVNENLPNIESSE